MADSFSKKEREKKRRKRKQDKAEKKKQNKLDGVKSAEFMYMDEDGHLSTTPPDPSKRRKIQLEEIEISVPKKSETDQEDSNRTGIVKFYNTEKRFGFISDGSSNVDYFVHADNLIDEIKENDKVEFELGSGPKGIIAINVKIYVKKPDKVVPPVTKEETEVSEDKKEDQIQE